MATPYNPDVHSSVVSNFRQMWSQYVPDRQLVLSDEKIWAIFDTWGTWQAADTEFPEVENRYDAAVLAEMVDSNIG